MNNNITETNDTIKTKTDSDLENLKKEVKELVAYTKSTHRYSMSNIYRLYNNVFGKKETPQSCASCLIRKIKELTTWLEEQEEAPNFDKRESEGKTPDRGQSDNNVQEQPQKRKGRKRKDA